jgi:thiol-disulfide isomerase/thioredoxin
MRNTTLIAVLALLTTGCTDPELEARVTALETQVKTLAVPGAATAASAEADKAAGQLVREASEAMKTGDIKTARAKVKEVKQKYSTTRAARSAAQLEGTLEIFGKDAGSLTVEKWYGDKDTTFEDGNATLVVFWEVWCPHCKREAPKLQATYEKYNSKGLNVVGLTRINKPDRAPESMTVDFIKESKITYPMAKENGSMAQHFAVQGIPAAAVVKDGKIVWRGHPAQLDDKMIEGFISTL